MVTLIFSIKCATAQIAKIPFEFSGSQIYINAKVNQIDSLRFIFDTGSTGTMIDSLVVDKLNFKLANGQTVQVAGSGGSQNYKMIKEQNLAIANLDLKDLSMVVVNFKNVSEAMNIRLDGIVGYNLIDKYVTQMDFDNKKLLFYTNIKEVDTSGYTAIPFEFSKGIMIPRFPISIELTSGETFTGRVMFDSGLSGTLLVSAPFNKLHQISEKLNEKSYVEGRGLNAYTKDEKSTISTMSFNGFKFREMPIRLTVNETAKPADGYLGIIGVDIIKRFNIILDYSSKKIYMKPNNFYNEAFTIS